MKMYGYAWMMREEAGDEMTTPQTLPLGMALTMVGATEKLNQPWIFSMMIDLITGGQQNTRRFLASQCGKEK